MKHTLFRQFASHFSHRVQAGVTLIEMLVVVGIIAVVSSVLMFNYSDFSTNVSVRNLAQEIALSVRKAQTYATSVRAIDGINSSTGTYPAYGISFAVDANSSANMPNPQQFVLFADIYTMTTESSATQYDAASDGSCGLPGPGNECVETFSINSADKITSICTDKKCYDETRSAQVNITFRRPSPDAIICLKENGSADCSIAYVTMNLLSAKGNTSRSVTVWNTGQISVK